MASIAWLVYSSLKTGQKHAGETNYPFSKGVLTSTLFQRCFAKIPFLNVSSLLSISLSQGSKHGSPSSHFQGLPTQFLQGCLQGTLFFQEGFHFQLQALIGSSSNLCPPEVLLVWCFDWVDLNPFFKGTLQNVHTVIEQGFAAIFDTQ